MKMKTLETTDPDTLCDMGLELAAQGQIDEAIEQYRKANARWNKTNSSNHPVALYHWADALRSKKLYEEAAEKCRAALQVDPEFAAAHNRLGGVLVAQEYFDERSMNTAKPMRCGRRIIRRIGNLRS